MRIIRRGTSLLAAFAMFATLAVVSAGPASAETCTTLPMGCGSTNTGSGGGGSPTPGPTPTGSSGSGSSNVDVSSGYSPYPYEPVGYYSLGTGGFTRVYPTGLPPDIGNFENNYYRFHPDCAFRYLYVTDPVTGEYIMDPNTGGYLYQWSSGVSWTDRRYYTYRSDGTRYLSGRDVSYSCVMPAQAYVAVRWCATTAGPGTLQGPLANSKGLPVMLGPGVVDPNTIPRIWTAPQKWTTLGKYIRDNGTRALNANPTYALSLVVSCPDLNYQFQVDTNRCVRVSDGATLTDPALCKITPGNYTTRATSYHTRCRWVQWPDGHKTFIDCANPSICTSGTCFYNRNAVLYCGGVYDPNGPDLNYNFATCGNTITQPTCVWSNGSGSGSITDPFGRAFTSGGQAPADGKAWKITWPTVSVSGAVTTSKWQQWIVSYGSPLRPGLPVDDRTQPIFGSIYSTTTATGSSDLVDKASADGVAGWSKTNLWVRLFRAAPLNTSGGYDYVGANEVSNPLTVANNQAIPFGLYARYNYTYPKTTSTSLGGSVTINVPGSCSTRQVLMYGAAPRVGK